MPKVTVARELIVRTTSEHRSHVHAFSDLKVHMEDVVAENDLVVFHDHVTATSVNEFFGVPPSGKSLEWTEIHFLRVANGQIVEHWTNFDQLGILRQLGAIPG
jgi:predicted ester cyclase